MARCSRAWLPLLLLASALVQSSCGSRPSPPEPQEPGAVSPVVHAAAERQRLRGDGAPQVQPSTEKGAAGHHGASAGDGGAVAASAMGGVSSEQRKGSVASVLQQALGRMLGSKLARRMLGGEAEDSAAGPSCHSNNARITCAPPAQH